jgi:hypothetical protein
MDEDGTNLAVSQLDNKSWIVVAYAQFDGYYQIVDAYITLECKELKKKERIFP